MPSQFSDPAGEFGRTLRDYIPVPDVYPVGRLDRDSLTDPRYQHPKTYLVQVEGAPADADLEPLRAGVVIQGYLTRPAQARILDEEPKLWPRDPPVRFRKSIPTAWIEVVLHEGRNRQVRGHRLPHAEAGALGHWPRHARRAGPRRVVRPAPARVAGVAPAGALGRDSG